MSDVDSGDQLIVKITEGPTAAQGVLTQFNDDPCNSYPCTVVDSDYRMKFIPVQYGSGQPLATIKFVANDGHLDSAIEQGQLYINHVDQPPEAKPVQVNLNENDPPVTFTFDYFDRDSQLADMSVTIVSLPSLGTLKTTGGATIAVGEKVLTPLQAVFAPGLYQYGPTSFSFKVSDATSTSGNVEEVSIGITHVNHAPTAYWAGTARADENSALNITQIQVSDPDVGDVISVTITQGVSASSGTLTQFDGSACDVPCVVTDAQYRMRFTPRTYAWGNPLDTIKFKANDRLNNSLEVSGPLYITFVDQPPVAKASAVVMNETDPDTTIQITWDDVDTQTADIKATILSLPSSSIGILKTMAGVPIAVGDVISAPHQVKITLNAYSYGVTNFQFNVKDAVQFSANTAKVTLTVNHVNHPPVAFWSGTARANEDTTMNITQIQANDPDTGDVVSIIIVAGPTPAQGSLLQYNGNSCPTYPCTVTDPKYRMLFVPAPDANGEPYTSIQFRADDGRLSSTATITGDLFVTAVDDPPVAEPTYVSLSENSDATFFLNYTDKDSLQAAVYGIIISLPSPSLGTLKRTNGTALAVGDTVLSLEVKFTPVSYTYGATTFSFQVHDATSTSANTALVTLDVQHVNHDPTSSNVSVVAQRGVPLSIVISGSDYDKDDTFTFEIVTITHPELFTANNVALTSTSANFATGVPNTPLRTFSTTLTFTAPTTAVGTNYASISFKVVDQGGLASSPQQLTIDMNPNSVPIATPEPVTAVQDFVSDPIELTGTDADPADASTLTAVITVLPTKGVLIVDSSTNVSTVPYRTAEGSTVMYYTVVRGGDSFEYHVEDLLNASSASVVVPITITPTNHAPTVDISGVITTLENTDVTITEISTSDPDGDIVSIWVCSSP